LPLVQAPRSKGLGSLQRGACALKADRPLLASEAASHGVIHEGSKLYAIIKTGGKQYKVAPGDTINVMALAGKAGDSVAFDRVLMVAEEDEPSFGSPIVEGASVAGQIVEQTRGPKAIAFKKRRRKNSKRKRGHRQDLTVVRITRISPGTA
jgi:large subunit ribosomal protein L21